MAPQWLAVVHFLRQQSRARRRQHKVTHSVHVRWQHSLWAWFRAVQRHGLATELWPISCKICRKQRLGLNRSGAAT